MFPKERCGCAEKPWLGMGDELHRHFLHPAAEASLGNESVAEARKSKTTAEPQPDSASDNDGPSPLRKSEIAGDGAEAPAISVKRCGGEAVATLDCRGPQHPIITKAERAILKLCKGFI